MFHAMSKQKITFALFCCCRYGQTSFLLGEILKGVISPFNTQFDYDEVISLSYDYDEVISLSYD